MNQYTPIQKRKAADYLKEESGRFSSIRLILIILVVYVHFPLNLSSESAGPLLPVLVARETFLRFSVLILTVISGFIMFSKGQDKLGFQTIKRKASTLLVPFLVFNTTLALALFLVQHFGLIGGQRLDLANGGWKTWCDALFACTARPVNYPLYFLRDLFMVSIVCVLLSPLIRRYTILCIVGAALIVQFELDSYLILRTQMLFAFMIGAGLAIYNVPLQVFEQKMGLSSAALAGLCLVQFYYPTEAGELILPLMGGVWVWSLSNWLSRQAVFARIVSLSKYSFPIYLLHGIFLFAFLAAGLTIHPDMLGLAIWLVVPLLVVACAVAAFETIKRVAPDITRWATGGRSA